MATALENKTAVGSVGYTPIIRKAERNLGEGQLHGMGHVREAVLQVMGGLRIRPDIW